MNLHLNLCRNVFAANGGTADAATPFHAAHKFTLFGQEIECPGEKRELGSYTDEEIGALPYVESMYFNLVAGFFEYEIRHDTAENILVGRFLGRDPETMTVSRDDKWLPYELRSTQFILANDYEVARDTLRMIAHCEIDGNYIEIR